MATDDVYRTRDGQAFFKFRFHDAGNCYHAYILEMPSYGNRSRNLHTTHRYETNSGYRICLKNEEDLMYSLSAARKWAGNWAEYTWRYIKTGKEFDNV